MFYKSRDYIKRTFCGSHIAVLKQGGVFMTYFVGIDIAKYHHDCFVLDHHGEVLNKPFRFDNNFEGFKVFLSVLENLSSSGDKIKIGFEATGHYGNNLKHSLIKSGYDFMEIHPVLIHRFSKSSTLRKTKTDTIDVQLITSYLMSVEYKPYSTEFYHINSLKSLTRSRDALIKERSLQLVRLTNILDTIFPEFKPFFSSSLKSATAQYLLTNYTTPSKISRMTQASYDKMKHVLRRTISYARFSELRDIAKNTVGSHDQLLEFQLHIYLDLYTVLDHHINKIDSLIVSTFSEIKSFIQTIPGIGIISAATILAEIGSVSLFDNPSQLVAFCGLDPAFYQSGQSEQTGRMVKRGSSYLRKAIMNCAQYTLLHNPHFYDYYRKKRKEGKAHRVALSHVAKKLIRIIFTLETKQVDFNPDEIK